MGWLRLLCQCPWRELGGVPSGCKVSLLTIEDRPALTSLGSLDNRE